MADETKLEEIAEKPAPEAQEQAKEEIKANLDKAIEEAQSNLREIRKDIKKAKTGEDELPKIDREDPSAQAWMKEIHDSTAPISSQLEKQKEEVRTFALRRFLSERPSLSKNPEKLKELMGVYDRIKTASEQTQEGVLMDLERAYGATFHQELISAAQSGRIDQAKEDMIASDIGISRGSTAEAAPMVAKRRLSPEEQRIVQQWEENGAPSVE